MARHNRVSIPGGYYTITTETVNGEDLFADSRFKDDIVTWINDIAAFSGVRLFAWCVLDNQLSMMVHVPNIPKKYWVDKSKRPASYAFGMRPTENRVPLYLPEGMKFDEDYPTPPRPELDFMLDDAEILNRLKSLYGNGKKTDDVRTSWARKRANNQDALVEADKARYCRRMYNLSQFVKSVKERIVREFKARNQHTGPVFAGRFISTLLEGRPEVLRASIFNVNYEANKAKMVSGDELYAWSSLGEAFCAGKYSQPCREVLEELWSSPWNEALDSIRNDLAEELPDSEELCMSVLTGKVKISPTQLTKLSLPMFSRPHYFGSRRTFIDKVQSSLPKGFPMPTFRHFREMLKVVGW